MANPNDDRSSELFESYFTIAVNECEPHLELSQCRLASQAKAATLNSHQLKWCAPARNSLDSAACLWAKNGKARGDGLTEKFVWHVVHEDARNVGI